MTMASFTSKILTLLIISSTLQEGCGLPVSDRAEQPAQKLLPRHIRTKRCSCNNWEDKECIYFCHLDIIWVTTPSKLLPYGLGSPLSRRRRSASRCECLNPADETCHGFCRQSSEGSRNEVTGPSAESSSSSTLLAFLRSVVKANAAIANGIRSSERSPSGLRKLKSRTRR